MRLFPAIIVVLAVGPAFPQALVEHAAAASGASIGAAGGKVVSNGITAIFGKVDETTANAAGKASGKEKVKEEKPAPVGGVVSGPEPTAAPIGSQGGTSTRAGRQNSSRRARNSGYYMPAPERVESAVAPAPVKEPGLEDLLKVQVGTKEQDCLAALGTPSSRITIPEEGHMTELWRYSAHGQLLGTIRLDNGQVVDVLPVNVAR